MGLNWARPRWGESGHVTGGSVATVNRSGRVGLRDLGPYLRSHRGPLAAVAVLSLVGAAIALAQPLMVRWVLSAVSDGRALAAPVAALVALLLTGSLLQGFERFLLQRTGEGVVLTARTGLAGHLLRLPVAEYDRRRTGDLLSRVGADTTLLRAVVTSGLFEATSGMVVLVGAAVAMLLLDPLLLAVTLGSVGLGVVLVIGVGRRVRELSTQAQARVGEMTASVERALTAVRTIRASQAQGRETAAIVGSAQAAYAAGVRAARLEALVSPAATIATQGSFILVLGVGGARVASGAIEVGDLVAFILYLFLLVIPLAQALGAFTTLQTGLGALQRIADIHAIAAEDAADEARADVPTESIGRRSILSERSSRAGDYPDPTRDRDRESAPLLALSDVDFSYAGGPPILRGVSFSVPRGTRTALVGPSGAGKSTILALVERFYDVTGGAVRVAGEDVRDVPRAVLRARLGYVEQEAPVLAGTLRENLRLTAANADQARLDAVIDSVNLRELVDRAPAGLDSEVGDGGVLLSGGERQRLAIARALLAAPALLLLDEPTSNLDARNEAALRAAVDAVARDRTLLVVAHRLSTVVDADQIVVLDRGEVVAIGRHEALVETSPLYRELASQQLLVP